MATIITKNSQTASAVPSAASLSVGELAVNTADGKLYTEHTGGVVKEIIPSTVVDGGITTAKIASNAVTTAKIADANVTVAKLSASGTPSSSTFLRGDGSWVAVGGSEAQGGRGQVFLSNGTFTIPTGVTALKVTVVGGGGGTVRRTDSGRECSSGGGAGGAAIAYLTGLTSGNTLSVTIGAGGTNVTTSQAAQAGNTGGTSSVSSGTQSITTISASGGLGGYMVFFSDFNGARISRGGLGGTASGGTINITGEPGDYGLGSVVGGQYGSSFFPVGGKGGNSLLGYAGIPANSGNSDNQTAATASGRGCGASGFAFAGILREAGTAGAGIVVFEW
jgi:hypothetical protein